MFGKWLKPYLPRSLFGRAVMILIVPIVVIQIVVGVVLVERLFQDVTRQMTRAVALDINYLAGQHLSDASADHMALSQASLGITLTPLPDPADNFGPDTRAFLDVSGAYVIQTLYQAVPTARSIDLTRNDDFVFLAADLGGEAVEFKFSRRRVSAKNPHQLLVAMVLAAILLTTLSLLFLNNQVKPIRRLSAAAEAFGKGQSLELRPRGAEEVRSATQSFLAMRARIERQIEQRTLMLSGVSHDLRTPLTRLRLAASMLPAEEAEPLTRDLDDMQTILDEFLTFAKGDAGEEMVEVRTKTLAKQLQKNQRRSGREVDLQFTGQTEGTVTLTIRRGSVVRALENLLGNAGKYGDHVRLTVYQGQGFVEFIVEDDGPGIRRDMREEALKPFARLDAARNQDKGSGVGLGLAIAADIARSHGGELMLGHSTDLGGLKASFRLPR